MKKFTQGGGLSLLLTLVLLGPIGSIAQTPAPGDDSAPAATQPATDETAPADAAQPTAEPAAEPQVAAEPPAAKPAKPESTSPFESLPEPYFKHPFFMLLVLIVVVALVWVLMRRRVKK
jgi:hypothetical protein